MVTVKTLRKYRSDTGWCNVLYMLVQLYSQPQCTLYSRLHCNVRESRVTVLKRTTLFPVRTTSYADQLQLYICSNSIRITSLSNSMFTEQRSDNRLCLFELRQSACFACERVKAERSGYLVDQELLYMGILCIFVIGYVLPVSTVVVTHGKRAV
jgi:hypothetical protein